MKGTVILLSLILALPGQLFGQDESYLVIGNVVHVQLRDPVTRATIEYTGEIVALSAEKLVLKVGSKKISLLRGLIEDVEPVEHIQQVDIIKPAESFQQVDIINRDELRGALIQFETPREPEIPVKGYVFSFRSDTLVLVRGGKTEKFDVHEVSDLKIIEYRPHSEARILTSSQRIRVTAAALSPKPIIGDFILMDADSLYLIKDPFLYNGSISVARKDINEVEVSQGKRNYWRSGALAGLLIGVATSIPLARKASRKARNENKKAVQECKEDAYQEEGFLVCEFVGILADEAAGAETVLEWSLGGFLVGGIIGFVIRTEVWNEININSNVKLEPSFSLNSTGVGAHVIVRW